ncbi:concanavalin A-like lectin/glucanase [Sistotremastrum suecicum HHB10207 ss-3]|uniref:Concanavalin A-like lectin/glucanase n=1 Tax=Sistotremastrum suecicum HHB10207 ss-3 TaxID=1314776 RepID=A0A166ABR0_9AGAM|nr:concanavalin A-like lectin/glucanase [Sistotremastrum suecicum HHB10207 ss-3]
MFTVRSLLSTAFLTAFFIPVSAQTITGATDCVTAGKYTFCQDLWGAASGVGSQNTTSYYASTTGQIASWSTTYNWANAPSQVKSFANVASNTVQGFQLATLATAPTFWVWGYDSSSADLKADVVYNIWLGTASFGTPASSSSNYQMSFLASSHYQDAEGSLLASAINIPGSGATWDIWSGTSSTWNVISFVSTFENTNLTADLKNFLQYLVINNGLPASLYIQSIQAGTDVYVGSAELYTTRYSVEATAGGNILSPPPSTSCYSTSPPAQTHYGQWDPLLAFAEQLATSKTHTFLTNPGDEVLLARYSLAE